ncbi:MAG: helix-turn-helix domain-containing protein [Ruminococcus sp.]|nr:helix-turn-helix domain-containing protein [Ruminococcus sp.]
MTEERIRVMTIPEAAKELHSIGIKIGEARLRTWCKEGTLPYVPAGRKMLINFDDVLGLFRAA